MLIFQIPIRNALRSYVYISSANGFPVACFSLKYAAKIANYLHLQAYPVSFLRSIHIRPACYTALICRCRASWRRVSCSLLPVSRHAGCVLCPGHKAVHYSASVFLHLAGVQPEFSLNSLMKWLGDRKPDLSEMSATVSLGYCASRRFA